MPLVKENIFVPKSQEEAKVASKGRKNVIWRIYSGMDAFEIKHADGNIYVPYIDVIASSENDARDKVARMLGQKLEDQDTNQNYNNYVSDSGAEIIGRF